MSEFKLNTQATHPRWVDFSLGIIVFGVLATVVILVLNQNKIFRNEVRWLDIKYERLFSANGQLRRQLANAQDICTIEECLVRDGKYGIASTKGYLQGKISCPTIKILTTSTAISSAFGTGTIVANTSLLSDAEKKNLASSSGTNVVSFVLMHSAEKETKDGCVSSVDILEVR